MIINPGDFDLLGFKFQGNYYIDKCLPMGCAISLKLFEKFSTFLQWELQRQVGVGTVFHYLDDFLFLVSAGSDECACFMQGFKNLCNAIGVPIAQEKTVGPSTKVIFLGLEIDTIEMVVRIPQEKVQQLAALLSAALIKNPSSFRKFKVLLVA